MNPVTTLIVSRDRQISRDLHERLTRLGHDVVGITAGDEETLKQLEALAPDVILTDIRSTWKQDSLKTWTLIRSTYNIPVIYVITNSGEAVIQQAKLTMPSGYIFTPYDDWQLLATLETAMDRHQLEHRLRESQKWLNTTLSSIGEGVIATNEQGLVQFINPTATNMTGWSFMEALGKPLQSIFTLSKINSPENPEPARMQTDSRLDHGTDFDGWLLSKTGDAFPVEAKAALINDDHGKSFGTVLVFRDATKQKEALQEIQRQALRAEALRQVASQLNKQIELEKVLNKICVVTNQALKARATALFLLEPGKDIFKSAAAFSDEEVFQQYATDNFEIPRTLLEALLSFDNPVVIIPNVQSYPKWPYSEMTRKQNIQTLVLAALFRRDQLLGALISVTSAAQSILPTDDITLLRGLADQASGAIENAELFEQVRMGRERQRKLSKSLIDIQEAERRHIARDLHDHLGQVLTGLQFMLETVKNQVDSKQKTELSEIQKTVSDVISNIREMSLNLRPSMLDDLGLIPTLEWHFTRYTSQTGIRVMFQHDELTERLPSEIETAAYRIVQEALTNVARYAQVQEVFVGLALHQDTLWLEIVDKGKGFEAAQVLERPSTGLGGMRERASLAGGYLVVESYLNQGTQIVAALPLSNKPIERRRNDRKNPPG
jgi:PAS domain S-box-containing protein